MREGRRWPTRRAPQARVQCTRTSLRDVRRPSDAGPRAAARLRSATGARLARQPRRTAPEPVRAVHQLVPMLVPGDATSDHAIQLRRLAHDMGLESEIFATAIHDDLHDESFLVHELPDRRLPGPVHVPDVERVPMVDLAASVRSRWR